ncbi:MAG TPA: hypothetical protein VF057_04820 [Thermoanaerobaculia bacterium]
MDDKNDPRDRDETIPLAKRTGREAVEPKSLPGEFADDLKSNRSTEPPDPPVKKRE